jgi:ABC-2 type transport system ATP-binding protein
VERSSAKVIDVRSLSKSFNGAIAVDDLSFHVERGELFSIVGPDGAGKTTTLRMLCGILPPTSGSATILEYDLLADKQFVRRSIGYLSQRFSLYGDLTVDENIEFFAEVHEVFDYRARREELLQFTRLTPFRTRLTDQLSGGMKQKLALACTLIHRPSILFLDEPTTGVDPVSRRDFWRILSDVLKHDITIVMTTPYLDEAERCSRVALMSGGSTLVVDTPQNVKRLMRGEVLEIVCANVRFAAQRITGGEGVRDVQVFGDRLNVIVDDHRRAMPAIESRLREAGLSVEEWRVVPPSLENVFIGLISAPAGMGREESNGE